MNNNQLNTSKACILVVDDTPANLRLLVNLLVEQGYEVRPALNGRRALLSAHTKPPDLILLDIMMPEMDGYEVCRQLKADERTRDIPVIFISALDQVLDKVKAFSSGAVDYVMKPFEIEEVLARIQTHLTIRQLQNKQQRLNNHLEEIVQARTAELVEANSRLRNEISERKRAEAEIQRRLVVEQTLSVISSRFMQVPDPSVSRLAFDRAISDTLADLGRLIQCERLSLFRFYDDDSRMNNSHEWHVAHLAPLLADLQDIPTTTLPWLVNKLRANEVVHVEEITQLPPSAVAEKEFMAKYFGGSWHACPLYAGAKLYGFLGCQGFLTTGSRLSEELTTLNVVVGMLTHVLHREMVLDTLSQQVADRTREMAAFFDVTMLASESRDMQEILEPIIGKTMEVARSQAVCIHLLTEQQTSLRLIAQRELPSAYMGDLNIMGRQDAFADWISKPNAPILARGLDTAQAANSQSADLMPLELRVAGFTSYLGAQLRARGKPLGVLSCFRKSARPFSLNEAPMVVALAEQLGVIVENHRLRQETKKIAVIEERQRLARELHDSVTQSLYSLRLLTNGWQTMAEQGLLDRLQIAACFKQLGDIAKQALKEMRLLLHQLRPALLSEMGLVGALQHRLEGVEQRAGLKTRLLTYGEVHHLPLDLEEQLFHIAQEALNNSLRHASATAVTIRIRAEEDHIVLKVEDNGRGFDATTNSAGMGLLTMQERAAIIGGQFSIMPTGQGTTVEIRIKG